MGTRIHDPSHAQETQTSLNGILTHPLRLYTGIEPQIAEDFGGIGLSGEHELGHNTVLGGGNQHVFTVTFEVDGSDSINTTKVRQIIEAEKPAHAGYILRIVEKAGQPA